jgi:hypothetical protein
MTEKIEIQESISDQIFNELISHLQKHDQFDENTVEKLRLLSESGELKKHISVINAIKLSLEHKA